MTGPKWRLGEHHYKNPNPEILEGIPSIAEYLGHSYTTIQRWINFHSLPANKLPNGRWVTTRTAILMWIFQGHDTEMAVRTEMAAQVGFAKRPGSQQYIEEYHRKRMKPNRQSYRKYAE